MKIDLVHLLNEDTVVRRQPDELRLLSVAIKIPDESLQEPRPERIERADASHIDRDVLGRADFRPGHLDQLFERLRMRSGPCTPCSKLDGFRRRCAVQERCRGHQSPPWRYRSGANHPCAVAGTLMSQSRFLYRKLRMYAMTFF